MDSGDIMRNAMEVLVEEASKSHDAMAERFFESQEVKNCLTFFHNWIDESRIEGINALIFLAGNLVGFAATQIGDLNIVMNGVAMYATDSIRANSGDEDGNVSG